MISTQIRGRLVQEAMNDMAWEDLPTDSLHLKEYEPSPIKNDDDQSKSKPNIKNTIRQYWELKEEKETIADTDYSITYGFLSNSEFDRLQPEDFTPTKYTSAERNFSNSPRQDFVSRNNVTPDGGRSSGRSRKIKNSDDSDKYRTNTKEAKKNSSRSKDEVPEAKSTQKTEVPAYMQKLVKAYESKSNKVGKLKFSQKLSFPASSTFACKKTKLNEASSQMSTIVSELDEDIENFDNLDPKGMYSSNRSNRKIKVDVKSNGNNRYSPANPNIKTYANERSNGTAKNQGQNTEKPIIRTYKKIEFQTESKSKKSTPT